MCSARHESEPCAEPSAWASGRDLRCPASDHIGTGVALRSGGSSPVRDPLIHRSAPILSPVDSHIRIADKPARWIPASLETTRPRIWGAEPRAPAAGEISDRRTYPKTGCGQCPPLSVFYATKTPRCRAGSIERYVDRIDLFDDTSPPLRRPLMYQPLADEGGFGFL
jgi:hypothetical protein